MTNIPVSPEVRAYAAHDRAQTEIVVELGQALSRMLERFYVDEVLPRVREGRLDRDHWRTCREQLSLVLEAYGALSAQLPHPGDNSPW